MTTSLKTNPMELPANPRMNTDAQQRRYAPLFRTAARIAAAEAAKSAS